MSWNWWDLVLFTGAVYGLAWLLVKSKLFERPRRVLEGVPFLGPLSRCIVCTGVWVGVGVMMLLPWTTLLSPGFRVRTVADGLVLIGWTVASTWGLAPLFDDAD
jgi:hypothetical protein